MSAVVSNTGPLIALAKADRLTVLEAMYGVVQIPPAVHRELLAKTGPEAQRSTTHSQALFILCPCHRSLPRPIT